MRFCSEQEKHRYLTNGMSMATNIKYMFYFGAFSKKKKKKAVFNLITPMLS
jgi:hypothetical protein